MENKRYLVFCRVSDSSLHNEWLSPAADKNFDIYIEYYGNQKDKFAEDCEFYSHNPPGRKYPRLFELIKKQQINLSGYDAIMIPDDDISTSASNINKLFKAFTEHELWLAQPALTEDSFIVHSITRVNPHFVLRYTNFVEPMCPIFSIEALLKCLVTFNQSFSGWGLDYVWPKILGNPADKIAVIDALPVKHTRKGGTGDNYKSISVDDRYNELYTLARAYDVAYPYHYIEYGGISK